MTQGGRSERQGRASVVGFRLTDSGNFSELFRHHMATWIWKDHPISLRIAVILMSILFLLLTLGQLQRYVASSGSLLAPSLAILFAASSYGMLRMTAWARGVTVVLLWLLVVLLIVGIFNPYLASDWSAGTPPSVATLLAYIIPAEAIIIWMLHILGKYKRRFE